ncbi:unnamed protein product [Schistosoma mattheei]|uniref:Uncharacterized protein n=1 Tax=Schistosoma mattheei TaxID=31246 RepID=A0A183P506_9TREM|nr:unnamed protein product [Schistosoma mattheei]
MKIYKFDHNNNKMIIEQLFYCLLVLMAFSSIINAVSSYSCIFPLSFKTAIDQSVAQASGYQDSVAKWITRWHLKRMIPVHELNYANHKSNDHMIGKQYDERYPTDGNTRFVESDYSNFYPMAFKRTLFNPILMKRNFDPIVFKRSYFDPIIYKRSYFDPIIYKRSYFDPILFKRNENRQLEKREYFDPIIY